MTNMNDDDGTDALPEDLGLDEAVVASRRPALLVQDGDFGEPPVEWEQLNAKRELLRGIFPSVGRVEIAETNRSCGTAFLVGEGILMTNKHVLTKFAQEDGGEWRFQRNTTVRIDYREEHENPTPSEMLVESIIGVHSSYDLALLRVQATDTPKPLLLRSIELSPVGNRDVVVIGYPDHDGTVTDAQVTDIFQGILGVKRLQPGKTRTLRGTPVVLSHDCSTLDGNSGSCVIDLETGQVIALHFGGTDLANLAVPLWKVAREPMMKNLNWTRKQRPAHS
jgi:V8-like Glu-specific endopeptidase